MLLQGLRSAFAGLWPALQAGFGMQRTCGSLLTGKVGDLGPPGILPMSRAKAVMKQL